MLAQIQSADPNFLKQFVLVVLGMIGGAGALATVYGALRNKRIEPQPLEVKAAQTFVSREHCTTLHAQASDRMTILEKVLNEFRSERRSDINDLHDKVNSIAREVSELKATTALELAQLARIDQKLADLQSR